MKFLIVGSGGTGGSIGAFLAESGQDVTFIARGKHLEEINKNGLKLKSDIKGQKNLKNIKAYTAEQYDDKADVIFVCVKSYSLDEIIPLIKKAAKQDTLIIPILNGAGAGDKLAAKLKEGIVLDGCIYIVAYISAPGEVTQMGDIFRIVYGERQKDDANKGSLKALKEVLIKAGIKVTISDNIKRDTFRKFSFISSYAACGAYYNINSGQMRENDEYKNTFIKLTEEFIKVSNAMGIVFDIDLLQTNIKILEAMEKEATASMQKDLEKGNKTEMDELIFQIVRLGDKYGVEVPTYKKIAKSFEI